MTDVRKRMYGAIVRLHPVAFRQEFGREMLLDFDEALRDSGFVPLCLDGLVSVARQWVSVLPVGVRQESFAQSSLLAGQYVAISPGTPSFLELFRAAVLSAVIYLAVGFASTLQHNRTLTHPGGLVAPQASGVSASSAEGAQDYGGQQGSVARHTARSSAPVSGGRHAANAQSHGEQAEPLLDPYWVASMKRKAIASTEQFAKTSLWPSLEVGALLIVLLELWKRRPRVAKWVVLASLIALAVAMEAQVLQASVPAPSTPTPQLEVATIKPSNPAKEHLGLYWRQPDGFKFEGQTLRGMINYTYSLQGSVKGMLQGGPAWMLSDAFDVQVKVDAATIERWSKLSQQPVDEERRAVLRELLAERFQLKFHRELREMPAFVLTVAKGGSKLQSPVTEKDLQAGVPQSRINFLGPGHWQGHFALLSNLSRSLVGQPEIGRPVVDETGLTGQYDFTLRWTPVDASSAAAPADAGEQWPSLFTALEEQLGLKLTPQKAQIEIIVIDSVEKPSEN